MCQRMSRCVLYLCNTLLVVFGFILFVVGCVFRHPRPLAKEILLVVINNTEIIQDHKSLDEVGGIAVDVLTAVSVGAIVSGLLIICTAIIGFCGTCKELSSGLHVYIFLIGIASIVTGIFFCYSLSGKQHFRRLSEKQFYETFTVYGETHLRGRAIHAMMKHLKCCGITNGTDFLTYNTTWKTMNPSLTVPQVCCLTANEVAFDCTNDPTTSNSFFHIGCFEKLWGVFLKHQGKISFVLGVVFVVCIIVILITCYICQSGSLSKSPPACKFRNEKVRCSDVENGVAMISPTKQPSSPESIPSTDENADVANSIHEIPSTPTNQISTKDVPLSSEAIAQDDAQEECIEQEEYDAQEEYDPQEDYDAQEDYRYFAQEDIATSEADVPYIQNTININIPTTMISYQRGCSSDAQEQEQEQEYDAQEYEYQYIAQEDTVTFEADIPYLPAYVQNNININIPTTMISYQRGCSSRPSSCRSYSGSYSSGSSYSD